MNNNSYINIRLLDIVSISRESVKEFDGIKKYLSTGDLDFDKIVNLEDITWENKPSRANQLVKENDVLFAKMKDTKKTLIIDDAKKDLIVSTGFYVLTVSEKIMPKYLYYFLSSEIFLRDKNKLCKGATQKALNNEGLSKIKILLPNLNLQYKTIDILDKAKNLIDKRKLQLEYLDELVKSKFIEMFGDPINNPMGWQVKKLKDISTKILSGNTPKGGSEVYVDSGIMFFRSQNVWKNKLVLDDIAYIDEDTHNKMLKSSLKHRDILMTKTGRINTENSSLGRAAMYLGEDDKANINGHVYLIRLKEEILNEFILFILTSKEYRGYIRSVCVGGIDKRQLNKEHIEDFPIIFPPIEQQKEFVTYVKQVDKLKFQMEKSLEELQYNFNSLMQRAFNGELFI